MNSPSRDRLRPPWLVVAAFVLLGAFWGCWAISLPEIQRTYRLSDGTLGIVLAIAVGTAGFAGALVGRLARRYSSLRLLAALLVAWALCSLPPVLTHSVALFTITFCVVQIAAGCVDAAMNAPATVFFNDRPGSLVRFHALFNVGALCGAFVASVALSNSVSWRWLWPLVAFGSVVAGVLSARGDPGLILDAEHTPHSPTLAPIGESAPSPAHLDRSLRADGLMGFLIIFALAEITEGGAFTWGVLYLRHHLHAGVLIGAAAYAIGHGVSAISRSLGGSLLRRTPVTTALVVGSAICAIGLVVEVGASTAMVAALGLTLATAGTSLIWPLVMSTVAQRSSRPGQAVGTFTAAGYVGWVAGAPLVGLVSDRFGAGSGLLLMAGVCVIVIIAVLAGIVPRGSRREVAPVV